MVVDDETYGTVCFADTETREGEFTDAESFFVELVARLVGQALERRAYERELTDRERAIKAKAEVHRAVVDSSFDLVFQIDTDGRFTYVSDTVEELLGYESTEYVDRPFTTMLPDRETIEVAEEVYEEVLAGETVEKEYFPLEHKSGDSVVVDIRVTPLFSGDVPQEERTPADIVGVQGMARDARDRHRRQHLIRVLNRVLRHNLRNDMNVIGNYADPLAERLTGENAEYVRIIGDTSDRLVTLSETARKLEQNLDPPPELAPVDVVPVVTRAANQIDEQYPAASITVDTPESATAKSAPRLETAVWELVENAALHAGETPSIAVTVLVGDDDVSIRISDDGPGLPDQERAVLVSGAETPLVHGNGLGLWLVHWIVESLDGHLTVPDEVKNTCVEISLRRPGEPAN